MKKLHLLLLLAAMACSCHAQTLTTKKVFQLTRDTTPDGTWLIVTGDPTGVADPHAITAANLKAWAIQGLGTGTLTGVAGVSNAPFLTLSGNTASGTGTLTIALASGQAANRVLASPNGSSGTLTVRALVGADLPDLSSSYAPAARTINGHALTANVTLTTGDLGMGLGAIQISEGANLNYFNPWAGAENVSLQFNAAAPGAIVLTLPGANGTIATLADVTAAPKGVPSAIFGGTGVSAAGEFVANSDTFSSISQIKFHADPQNGSISVVSAGNVLSVINSAGQSMCFVLLTKTGDGNDSAIFGVQQIGNSFTTLATGDRYYFTFFPVTSYDPAAVSITGGTIDNTPIGGTTRAAGNFTAVSVIDGGATPQGYNGDSLSFRYGASIGAGTSGLTFYSCPIHLDNGMPIVLSQSGLIQWSGSGDWYNSNDTFFGRDSSGTVTVTNTQAMNGTGTFKADNFEVKPTSAPKINAIWSDGSHVYWRDAGSADHQLDN